MKPDNIRLIREGKKTQTRRIIKPQPDAGCRSYEQALLMRPRYLPGELVYVKEQYCHDCLDQICYDRGESECEHVTWHSPLFLPEKFARTFLRIKDVRPERLQDITEEDAKAEGAKDVDLNGGFRVGYAQLWDSINKPPHDWAANDWVWVYSFAHYPKPYSAL